MVIARYLSNAHEQLTKSVIVTPAYKCTWGGGGVYYGLVVMPPCPQTLNHLRDNLKHPYQIASICYTQIDIGERIAGKQDGPSLIICGPPRLPPNSQKCKTNHIGAHI